MAIRNRNMAIDAKIHVHVTPIIVLDDTAIFYPGLYDPTRDMHLVGIYSECVEDFATNDGIIHVGTVADVDHYAIVTVPLAANSGDVNSHAILINVVPAGTLMRITHVDVGTSAGSASLKIFYYYSDAKTETAVEPDLV